MSTVQIDEKVLGGLIESNKRLERQVVEMHEKIELIYALFRPSEKPKKKTKKEIFEEKVAKKEVEYLARLMTS